MSPAQKKLYFREWNAARRALRALGWEPAKADAERHAIHARVLGSDVSSSALRNDELDKVLAAFRAVSRPERLEPQLNAMDQPARRKRWVILHATRLLLQARDDERTPEEYVNSVAFSLNREGKLGKRGKWAFDELDEKGLLKVLIAITAQCKREGVDIQRRKDSPQRRRGAEDDAETQAAFEEEGVDCPF